MQTPLCLHGQKSPVGYSPGGHKESGSGWALCLPVLGIRRDPTPAWQPGLKQPLGGEHRTPPQRLAWFISFSPSQQSRHFDRQGEWRVVDDQKCSAISMTLFCLTHCDAVQTGKSSNWESSGTRGPEMGGKLSLLLCRPITWQRLIHPEVPQNQPLPPAASVQTFLWLTLHHHHPPCAPSLHGLPNLIYLN